ncbi:Crnn [Phodopus roborovskii]|uniref:Crnn protein n=2 Tax=Phodopus roborovskii TaxID=109678 RepID=A0AAU9ZVC3_PHORO|nr:Crnn [Phodopus roborovskii]
MPQLLQNIHGIIEAFGCYARSEGGCKVLTRGELKRLLEHELADVIVNPHDPSTVDEVLRLLDEDNTGTVEFKEFLVLVFKVARACFKTLSESSRGACMSDKSEQWSPGSLKELEQGQRGGTGKGRDGTEQCFEDNSSGQRNQASKDQVRVETHTQNQDSYPMQVNSHDRQGMVSQQTQVTGQVEQTRRREDQSWTRERRSERQPQTSQQTAEAIAGPTTQTQADVFQTQGSTCGQDRGTNSHSQDRRQEGQAATQHYQVQAESHTQIHTQTVEQGWRQRTGSDSIQKQGSIYDQNRETDTHSQDRNQTGQAAKEHHQAQSNTHTQTMEQGRSQQAENSSIQTRGSIYDQSRTEIHGQDSSHAGQIGTGHFQTQTLEHDRSQSASQVGAPEKGQTQIQSGMGRSCTPANNYETEEPVLGGQVQTETRTMKERQDWSSNHPSPKRGQGERVPTVIRDEWVNDHTREIVIRSQDPGSLHSRAPSAQGQGAAQMEEKKGITAKGQYSYLKTDQQ